MYRKQRNTNTKTFNVQCAVHLTYKHFGMHCASIEQPYGINHIIILIDTPLAMEGHGKYPTTTADNREWYDKDRPLTKADGGGCAPCHMPHANAVCNLALKRAQAQEARKYIVLLGRNTMLCRSLHKKRDFFFIPRRENPIHVIIVIAKSPCPPVRSNFPGFFLMAIHGTSLTTPPRIQISTTTAAPIAVSATAPTSFLISAALPAMVPVMIPAAIPPVPAPAATAVFVGSATALRRLIVILAARTRMDAPVVVVVVVISITKPALVCWRLVSSTTTAPFRSTAAAIVFVPLSAAASASANPFANSFAPRSGSRRHQSLVVVVVGGVWSPGFLARLLGESVPKFRHRLRKVHLISKRKHQRNRGSRKDACEYSTSPQEIEYIKTETCAPSLHYYDKPKSRRTHIASRSSF